MRKKRVAFICVHNSCRSQIAEALGKYLAYDVFESYSVEIIQLVAFQGVDRFYNPSFEDNAAVSFDVAIVLQCVIERFPHLLFGDEVPFVCYHAVDCFLFEGLLDEGCGCFHSFAALLLGDSCDSFRAYISLRAAMSSITFVSKILA